MKVIVELLIEKGIDINQKDKDGYDALHLAFYIGFRNIEIVELLKSFDIITKTED